jgi:tellurium resistance protein TerD
MSQQPNPIVSHGEEADLGGVGGGASSFAGGLLPGDVHVNHTPGAKLLCQLMWEYYDGMDKVDLDCSAICFDETGTIMDAVYYNCLSILDGCIVHSGDSREGAKDGVDESITVDLDHLPVSAKVIVFVINAHSGGTLDSVESANAEFLDDAGGGSSTPVGSITLGTGAAAEARSKHTALIMGAVYRSGTDQNWYLRSLQQPEFGFNFNDCLIPIRHIVDTMLDEGMKYERVLSGEKTFDMKKGDIAVLPPGTRSVAIGLGWTTRENLDLDGSVVLVGSVFPNQPILIDTVMYSKTEYKNKHTGKVCVKHSGDNLTGEGDGDDETINVMLAYLPDEVKSLVFVVNVFTSGGTFNQCRDSYVALRADSDHDATDGKVLAKFTINGNIPTPGLVFARLERNPDGEGWAFETIGEGCFGKTATMPECMDVVLKKKPGVDIPRNSGGAGADNRSTPGRRRRMSQDDGRGGSSGGGCCVIS